jgi:hypothetical protein
MSTFCDARTCPSGAACSNRPFQQLPQPRTAPFLTRAGRGWGLKAVEPIGKGTFVVEYLGEILNDVQCEQRLWADKAAGETNFYMMEVNRNQVIDARRKGNVSRLINSACEPNCETQRWVDGATGETRVGIFTLRHVAAGEELTCVQQRCCLVAVACCLLFAHAKAHLTCALRCSQLRLLLHALRRRRRRLLPLLLRLARLPRHAGRQPAARPQPRAPHRGGVGRRCVLRRHRG